MVAEKGGRIRMAWLLAKQIMSLFLMMGSGFLLVKLKLLNSEDSRVLSVISIYLIMPCVIIHSFQIEYTDDIKNGFLFAIAAAVIIHILLFLLCGILNKFLPLERVEKASLIYSNAGNLVIPLVTAVLGEEWVIYSSAFICVQTIMLWTHGQSLMQGKNQWNWKKLITNINLISVMIGIGFFFAKIQLPEIIGNMMTALSAVIGPISMILLGMLLTKVHFKDVLASKKIYIVVVFKMLLFPGIILLFLKCSGLTGLISDGQTILLISFLAVITPSATTVTQMAQLYDCNAAYASAVNAVTTVVCIATMPFMVMLYML